MPGIAGFDAINCDSTPTVGADLTYVNPAAVYCSSSIQALVNET
jgi:hypothetical protein